MDTIITTIPDPVYTVPNCVSKSPADLFAVTGSGSHDRTVTTVFALNIIPPILGYVWLRTEDQGRLFLIVIASLTAPMESILV